MIISFTVAITFLIVGCPNRPKNIQISNVNSRNLTINWTEPFDNNAPIIDYDIGYRNRRCLVMALNISRRVITTTTEVQVTITGLHPGRYYTFAIFANNDICYSRPGVSDYVRTLDEGM